MPVTPTRLERGGVNAIGRMLGLLGDEWNLLILQQALMGATRYRHFTDRLPISNAVLAGRLRMLCDAGMLQRHTVGAYRPTPRSRSLWPVLLCIWEWERTWVSDRPERLPAMRHETCGEHFSPVLRCAGCHAAISTDDVEFTLGPSGDWARSAPRSATRRRAERQPAQRQAGLFAETMTVFGNRWAAALIVAAFLGTSRFTDFQGQLGAPPSVLSQRLQAFCAIGVLYAAAGAERTAYLLTDKGRALTPVLISALQWAQRWFRAPEGPAIEMRHRRCGAPLSAELACDGCGQRLRGSRVEVVVLTGAATAGSR